MPGWSLRLLLLATGRSQAEACHHASGSCRNMLPVGRKAASRPALPSASSFSASIRAAAAPSSQRQPQPRGTGPQPHLGTQGRPSKDQSHSHFTKPPQGSSADKQAPSRPPLVRRQHWPSPPQHGVPAGLPGPAPPARASQGREAASGCPPATSLSRDTVQSGPPRPAPRQAAEPAVGSDTAQQAARAWQLRVQSGTAASTSYTATSAHGQARYGKHRPVPEQGSPQSTAAAHSELHPINLAGTSMSQRQQGVPQSQPSNSQGSNMQRPQPLVPVPAPPAADVRGLSSRQHARTQAAPSQEAPARAASAVRMRGRPGVSLPTAGPFPPHQAHDSRPRLQTGQQPPLLRPAAAAPKSPASAPIQHQIPRQSVPHHPRPAPLPSQSQQVLTAAQRPPPCPSNGANQITAPQKQPAARLPTSTHPTVSAQNALRPDVLCQQQQQQVPAGASNGAFRQNPPGLHKVQPWQNRPPRSYRQPLQHNAPQPDRASIPELGVSEQHLPQPADTKPLAEADSQLRDVSKGGEAARDPTVAEKLLEKGFEPYSFEVGEQQNGLLCPVCKGGDSGEKSLSLCIQEATFATWHCFRSNKCGYEGAVSSEIPLDDGDLPELPGSDDGRPARARRRGLQPAEPCLEPLGADLAQYLRSRGIDEATQARNSIMQEMRWSAKARGRVSWLAFVYRRHGQLVNVKYRSMNKEFMQMGGAEPTLYGLDDAEGQAEVIFVEGEIDKLSLEVAGLRNAVSVPNGAPAKAKTGPVPHKYDMAFQYLWNAEHIWSKASSFVLATDTDQAGDNLALELARRLGPEKCRRASFALISGQADCKDANEMLLKHGPAKLREAISRARPMIT